MDEQQTGRRAGVPAASSRRPPAARSMPSMQAKTRSSAARRSSPDAAQRSPVVGPPSLLARRGVAECRKGFKRAGWPCRAVAEQRSTDQLMLSPPAHAEAAAARQPAGGPPPPAHAEAAAARPPPTDRPMDGGWTERGPSSATVVSAAPASGRQQQQPRAKDGDNCWPTGRQRG